jgi:hypothetical protein
MSFPSREQVAQCPTFEGYLPLMSDRIDHDSLYRLAESQAGYFTAEQALQAGMDRSTLLHHAVRAVRRHPERGSHHPAAGEARPSPQAGVKFHVLTQVPSPNEARRVGGVLATTPSGTIVDSLEAGTQLEQISSRLDRRSSAA